VRPNPSVEPTPSRVAPWPGAGYKVHSPSPGQGASLLGSSHLKRYAPEIRHLTQLAAVTRFGSLVRKAMLIAFGLARS
jgi:hypothetical protein